MPENLARKMGKILPPELVEFLHTAADIAEFRGEKLYLVGGAVRDLMLGKGSYDIDLVVEGDGIGLAKALSGKIGAKLTVHGQFGTAKLEWKDKWDIDITTSRSETYALPGALPTVKPGNLKDDLFRRDFTVNAMAVPLTRDNWGKGIDFYGGRDDLKNKLIRILHEKSFVDDATRIWRAIRYARRLDFSIEEKTLGLLKRDIPMLDTISGDRICYELECVFTEDAPEKVLSYASELGVLKKVHPRLKAGRWLTARFKKARELGVPDRETLYFALLTYNLGKIDLEKVIVFLRPNRTITRVLRDVAKIKESQSTLARTKLANSRLYHLLHSYSLTAIQAVTIATGSKITRERLNLYLNNLRLIKPSLTGEDLKKMGIPEGPKMKEILQKLLDARLDGKVKDREGEEQIAKSGILKLPEL